MEIKFSPPDITEAEIEEVADTLRNGWITTGPKTKRFEREIADYCHTSQAVCLSSATACMEMTLRVMGVGPGDEVITTAYTYTASCSVICHVGAVPVLVDVLPGSYEMDPEQVRSAVTEKTKAIIAVDLAGIIYGHYGRLFEIAEEKRNLFVPSNDRQKALGRIFILADAAHAFGARQREKMCGEIADFTCFSFHAVKNLTTAEGGAVVWKEQKGIDSNEVYKEYMLLSLHGQSKDALEKTRAGAWEYDIAAPYYKCNMTDIMASIGLVQLGRYESILNRRREIVGRYNDALKDADVRVLPHYTDGSQSSGHLYMIHLSGKTREECNQIIESLADTGIAANVHYKPLPMLSAYKNIGFDIKDFPNAYAQFESEITLPLHTCLTDEEVSYIIKNLRDILEEHGLC
ncbi:MAG: DegT/DnrJ/EryC1/StrS family aminotransferase [Dorea sp.]|jgi:dTDP-4-amino-4,6-dideoxygalactose transaminase|nr:DegT/DnrJ/EryC1/StrS family aminotransferase [Dorea sp.]